VLPRHLSLRLLAPTVLVSLLLVAACGAGMLYLDRLHTEVSRVLTENVESTLAAQRLETTVHELIRQLRDTRTPHDALTKELDARNRTAERQLQAIVGLANLDEERDLAGKIAAGLQYYREGWEGRAGQPPEQLAAYDAELAGRLEGKEGQPGVLRLCRDLRHYNTRQVGAANNNNAVLTSRLTWMLLVVGVGAPLSGLLLGYAVARSMYLSVLRLGVRIRDAAGRLNADLKPVTIEGPDDLPALHEQMHGVLEEIERVVRKLQQREHAVLRAEQLAAVGQVAAGVAHELRNPLTSVKMLVQTGLEGPRPGLAAEDLEIIEHEIRRMEASIQTFLDFARPPQAERRRADLLAVVRRSLALVEARARRQGVACKADVPPGPVEVDIDAEQIHQVLLNLLLNSLDFLPHGGEIHLEVRPAAPDSPRVAVTVRDTGPGLAPWVRERLFEPFVSGKETGLGLGLSISRRLIEAHGGTMTGDNAPSGGAVFRFTLPAADRDKVTG
jgi:two-component system, NtrC family, sensor histidine kinase HydH